MTENVISCQKISRTFGDKTALDEVSLTIRRGQIYGLLGQNGAGKTTLMKIMLGLLHPNSGSMTVLGSDAAGSNRSYLKRVGSLIETPLFYNKMSVLESLQIHCDYLQLPEYKSDIPKILELVSLSGMEHNAAKELSLGQKQRLAIGRAMLCDPELLILDEPINGIDPEGIANIRKLFLNTKSEKGTSMIISSHIIDELEKQADVIGILHEGRLVEEIPSSIFRQADYDLEAHFISILHKGRTA